MNLAPSGTWTSIGFPVGPSKGTLSLSGSTVTYTPNGGTYGADSFTFNATGPGGTSAAATVSVNVGAPPVPTASVSNSWSGYRDNYGSMVSDPVVCSATGGTPGYSFNWEKTGGDSVFYANNPDGDTTEFIRDSDVTGYFAAEWRCRVTDAAGVVAYSQTISSVWNYNFDN